MIEKMTDPVGGMADELTAVISKTLPTILQTLVRMGKIRKASREEGESAVISGEALARLSFARFRRGSRDRVRRARRNE